MFKDAVKVELLGPEIARSANRDALVRFKKSIYTTSNWPSTRLAVSRRLTRFIGPPTLTTEMTTAPEIENGNVRSERTVAELERV